MVFFVHNPGLPIQRRRKTEFHKSTTACSQCISSERRSAIRRWIHWGPGARAGVFLAMLLLCLPSALSAEEKVLAEGEEFSNYRIYHRFKAPLLMRYSIERHGNARLLKATDSKMNRLMVLARTVRLTGNQPASAYLKLPGCEKEPSFDQATGNQRCASVESGVPLIRLLIWEKTAGLLHVLIATVQKEDQSLLDQLQGSVEAQPGFYYPDDGL
tara:strand:+ start:193674 stop:194315 length:642 start_codon:yes stop_codon:yes gene_type:complete